MKKVGVIIVIVMLFSVLMGACGSSHQGVCPAYGGQLEQKQPQGM